LAALVARLCFSQTRGKGISLAKLQLAPVTLRLRSGGETLRPHPHAATRTLKNLLQEHQVSALATGPAAVVVLRQ